MHRISVIVPVYNESAIIGDTLSAVIDFAALNKDFYFLFVNDGSTDDSAEIIKNRIGGMGNVGLIDSNENNGKAKALKSALKNLESDYICFTDGDMAYSLNHLHGLTKVLESHDVVIGNRKLTDNQQPNSIKRAVAGEIFNRLVRVLLNLEITDTQAGIKGFKKEAAKNLFRLSHINNFAFDAEILYIAKLKGYSIGQIPVKLSDVHQHHPSNVKVIRDSPGMFFSLLKIVFYRIKGKYNE